MSAPYCLLEINTRVWLRELGGGHPLTLNAVPDTAIHRWKELGFDAVWLMGVWRPSVESRRIAREHPGLRADYDRALPGWTEADVVGSPYAIARYEVNAELGGEQALRAFRDRLHAHGLRLILDFVSNHTALDHPWLSEHPEWYIRGNEAEVVADSSRWFWLQGPTGPQAFAHGRDPYFPPWTDTAQLDYHHPALQTAMCAELRRVARLCDGVRCDMAMLELADVFERIWGRRPAEFWPRAIREMRDEFPDFFFMAEVYWGLENVLLEMGFDAVYDKYLLDRVLSGEPLNGRDFAWPQAEHRRRVRFLENHDEQRIAARLAPDRHMAAASWVMGLPAVRLFYDGQLEGRRVRLPVQLIRAPQEPPDVELRRRYEALLGTLRRDVVRAGEWQLLNPQPAWSGNGTHQYILGQGYDLDQEHLRIFVNWSDTRSQCWVRLELGPVNGRRVMLQDLLGPKSYIRDGVELMLRGLYLDLEPWEVHVFDCRVEETITSPSTEHAPALPSLSELRR